MTSGIIIESALVFGLQIAPEIEKKIAKALSFTEENTVMVCQAALIAFIVKTCKYFIMRSFFLFAADITELITYVALLIRGLSGFGI